MRCNHWACVGNRCEAEATRLLIQDDGKPNPGGFYCERHGTAIVTEYAKKLNETWTLVEVDDLGDPKAK